MRARACVAVALPAVRRAGRRGWGGDPARPVRSDNAEACPQPLVDRARAIMAYALDLIGKARAPIDPAKPVDPLDALRTAVDVFRFLTAPSPSSGSWLYSPPDLRPGT